MSQKPNEEGLVYIVQNVSQSGGPKSKIFLYHDKGKTLFATREGTINSICFHNGRLYDTGVTQSGEIRETLSDDVVANRDLEARTLFSHKGLLYDIISTNRYTEILKEAVRLARIQQESPTKIEEGGRKLDSTYYSIISETESGRHVIGLSQEINDPTFYNGKLWFHDFKGVYEVDLENATVDIRVECNSPNKQIVFQPSSLGDTLHRYVIPMKPSDIEENEFDNEAIWSFGIHNGQLYVGTSRGRIFTGEGTEIDSQRRLSVESFYSYHGELLDTDSSGIHKTLGGELFTDGRFDLYKLFSLNGKLHDFGRCEIYETLDNKLIVGIQRSYGLPRLTAINVVNQEFVESVLSKK